jgi:hypothetical protein
LWIQGDHFSRSPLSLRRQYPALSQLHELVSDMNVVGEASKPYAFICAAHTLPTFWIDTHLQSPDGDARS